ncbi:MAG: hypothetical protein QXT64_07745 [Desulfurococcaceae archaeon]
MARLVKVVWMDAMCLETVTHDSFSDLELKPSVAFGQLVHEAEDFLAIAQVIHPDEDPQQTIFKNVVLIPRNSIVELVELTEKGG